MAWYLCISLMFYVILYFMFAVIILGHFYKSWRGDYLLTYLLTPWSRVLFEKLTITHLVQKFPAFYGTQRLITAFTIACHLFLS